MMPIKYSVVIPLKDEEGNIEELTHEVEGVMNALGEPWELICIDDGSRDRTFEILKNLKKTKPFLKPLSFNKNYGQSSAFDAGFKTARGEFVITLDGDRQNDPADIPKLLSFTPQADLICGQRVQRRDTLFKRFISKAANSLRRRVCQDGVQDTGCSLKVYRTDCLRKIKLYHGMHRFLPALFNIEGFRVMEVPVNHRKREHGKTKYNIFNRSLNTIFDLFAVWWMRKRQLRWKLQTKEDV